MSIKATKLGTSFIEYGGGDYRNTFDLAHEIDGVETVFGQKSEFGNSREKRADKTFRLDDDDTEYQTYDGFEAAYYTKFPERKQAIK